MAERAIFDPSKRRGWPGRVVAVVASLVGLIVMATSAGATDEEYLPMRTGYIHNEDGSVTVRESPDYAKSKFARVRDKASWECEGTNWLCIFEDQDGGGSWYGWKPGQHHDNLMGIRCPLCGPGKTGSRGTFNDNVSSFMNNTGQTWWWYFDADGYGERHNMNQTGDDPFNLSLPEQDEMSSLYSWG